MEVECAANEVVIPDELLPYFKTWQTAIKDGFKAPHLGNEYIMTEDPYVHLGKALWRFIIKIYSHHYKMCEYPSVDHYTTPISIDAMAKFRGEPDAPNMRENFLIIYALHFYESTLLQEAMVRELMIDIRDTSLDDLRSLLPGVPFEAYQPVSYKEQISVPYATWRNAVRIVLSYYTNNIRELMMSMMERIPALGPIIAHGSHTMMMTRKGLFATGNNKYGQLGLGDVCTRHLPLRVDIDDVCSVVVAGAFTIILTRGGFYACGTLPLDERSLAYKLAWTPQQIITRGLWHPRNIVKVACSRNHIVFISGDGDLFVCGGSTSGQLGAGRGGNMLNRAKARPSDPRKIEGLPKVVDAACGEYHTWILTKGGLVYATGLNEEGQLGLKRNYPQNDRSSFEQIDTGSMGDVIQIACGGHHSMMLMANGSVFGCGANSDGQLGVGDLTVDKIPTLTKVNLDENVASVACGHSYTMMITEEGSLFACGRNKHGQLGLGDLNDRATPTRVNITPRVLEVACRTDDVVPGIHTGSMTFILTDEGLLECGAVYDDSWSGALRYPDPRPILRDVNILIGHENFAPTSGHLTHTPKRKGDDDEDKRDKRPRIGDLCTICPKGALYSHPEYRRRFHFCSQQCYERFSYFNINAVAGPLCIDRQ